MKSRTKKIIKYVSITIGVFAAIIGLFLYVELKNGMYNNYYAVYENEGVIFESGDIVEALDGVMYKPGNIDTVVYKGQKALRFELVIKAPADEDYIFDPKQLTLTNTLEFTGELIDEPDNLEAVKLPLIGDEKRYVYFKAPNEYVGSALILKIDDSIYSDDDITYMLDVENDAL